MRPTLTDGECIEAVKKLEEAEGNKKLAAAALNMPITSFRRRLDLAAIRGLCGTEPVLPGFGIKQISVQEKNGVQEKSWIKQGPVGEHFVLPDGHIIRGISALTDSGGKVIQQWVKTKFEDATSDIVAALKASFEAYSGHATIPEAPQTTYADQLTIYPVGDHHLGLYAWAEEAGENYDLRIGEQLLRDTMASLVASSPPSKVGVILNLGDFFHSDTNANRTPKSGNQLDVDSRYAKILRVGVDLIVHCVQLALQKHGKVIVRCLPGNHDPYASIALSTALACFFSGSKRVTVDTDPSAFWMMRWGKVLLASTHGDNIKPENMPGVVAARWAKDWGETEYRYGYLGHIHKRTTGGEKDGLTWETFQTLSPKDEWGYRMGFTSGRSMVAITHHKELGEIMRQTASVRGPK